MKRMTLNMGLRFDAMNAYVPAQTYAATPLVPERSFGAIENVPNWKDINPRLGIAYDFFGNGRTAIKADSAASWRRSRPATAIRQSDRHGGQQRDADVHATQRRFHARLRSDERRRERRVRRAVERQFRHGHRHDDLRSDVLTGGASVPTTGSYRPASSTSCTPACR